MIEVYSSDNPQCKCSESFKSLSITIYQEIKKGKVVENEIYVGFPALIN